MANTEYRGHVVFFLFCFFCTKVGDLAFCSMVFQVSCNPLAVVSCGIQTVYIGVLWAMVVYIHLDSYLGDA